MRTAFKNPFSCLRLSICNLSGPFVAKRRRAEFIYDIEFNERYVATVCDISSSPSAETMLEDLATSFSQYMSAASHRPATHLLAVYANEEKAKAKPPQLAPIKATSALCFSAKASRLIDRLGTETSARADDSFPHESVSLLEAALNQARGEGYWRWVSNVRDGLFIYPECHNKSTHPFRSMSR